MAAAEFAFMTRIKLTPVPYKLIKESGIKQEQG
jgi:hypothetical protein